MRQLRDKLFAAVHYWDLSEHCVCRYVNAMVTEVTHVSLAVDMMTGC